MSGSIVQFVPKPLSPLGRARPPNEARGNLGQILPFPESTVVPIRTGPVRQESASLIERWWLLYVQTVTHFGLPFVDRNISGIGADLCRTEIKGQVLAPGANQ